MPRRQSPLPLLAAVLALAACGGDGGPSKADYIARADRICAAARPETAPLVAELAAGATSLTPARAPRLAAVAGRVHDVGTRQLARLRALEQPSGDRDAIEEFLASSERVVAAVGEARGALARADAVRALAVLQRTQPIAADADRAAQEYGFRRCGSLVFPST